jgi:hypothetical protein
VTTSWPRKELIPVSDQLGSEILQLEPCGQAHRAAVERRFKALESILYAGDWLIANCGYVVNPEGRDKNIRILQALADTENSCAAEAALDELEEEIDGALKELEELQ